MKKNLLKIFIFSIIFLNIEISIYAETNAFKEGKKYYENKNYKEAKIKFERNIVFNPKSEISYLYLAKIFKKQNKDDLEKNNLNTVILLNPKNEEAIYHLALLSIKESNFSKAKELIKNLELVCKNFCNTKKELENKLKDSLK